MIDMSRCKIATLTLGWIYVRIRTFGTNQEHFSAVQHQILRCSMTPTVGITDPTEGITDPTEGIIGTPPWELQKSKNNC